MRTDQYTISLERCQVSPYGRCGNPQSGTEVGSSNGALTGKYLSNAKSAFFREHDVYALLTSQPVRISVPTSLRIRNSAAPILLGTSMICIAKSESLQSQSIRNKQFD